MRYNVAASLMLSEASSTLFDRLKLEKLLLILFVFLVGMMLRRYNKKTTKLWDDVESNQLFGSMLVVGGVHHVTSYVSMYQSSVFDIRTCNIYC